MAVFDDPEVEALRVAYEAISARPRNEHNRMMRWLNDRMASDHRKADEREADEYAAKLEASRAN